MLADVVPRGQQIEPKRIWRPYIQANELEFRVLAGLFPASAMPFFTVRQTNVPAIKNAPIEGLFEGNGSFNNIHLAALVVVVPWFVKRMIPLVNRGGFKTYVFLLLLLGLPVTMGYWTVMSMYGKRKNEKVQLPCRNLEEYITIHDPELKAKYHGKEKIPMQVFHDAYFEGKIDFNGV